MLHRCMPRALQVMAISSMAGKNFIGRLGAEMDLSPITDVIKVVSLVTAPLAVAGRSCSFTLFGQAALFLAHKSHRKSPRLSKRVLQYRYRELQSIAVS